MILRLLSVSALFLLLASPVAAETFVRTGGQFELPQGQVLEGNFMAVGTPVSLSGTVTEDALLLGNQVTVTGETGGDLLAGGVLTKVSGAITGDARLIGGAVTLSGTIDGDVLVVADSVTILSDAVIAGDVLLYVRSASVAGSIGGDVKGSQEDLLLTAQVGGGVDVVVTQFDLGQTASITESVRYTSHNLLTQAVGAVVGGTVLRNDPVGGVAVPSLRTIILPFLTVLFATLLWQFLSPRTLNSVTQKTIASIPRSALTGIVAAIVLPVIVFVLFISFLGVYVGILGLIAYLLLWLLTFAALPAVIGAGCLQLAGWAVDESVSVVSVLIGAAVAAVFLLLPGFGFVVLLLMAVLVFGGLVEAIIRSSR